MQTLSHDKKAFLDLLKKRGIRNKAVIHAMREVPREAFVGLDLAEFAYDDAPLPIEEGQTISQPYIVALMTEALRLEPDHVVLEVGTGSGYGAAILSRIAKQVYSVERHKSLAHQARTRLQKLNYTNVEVICGDGSLGWPEQAPYDAIVVTAGSPEPPESLIKQLRVGGRLVIPAGRTLTNQTLMRITRTGVEQVKVEELAAVRFVPLVGKEGWDELEETIRPALKRVQIRKPEPVSELIEKEATHIPSIETVDLTGLLERVGDARLVLLGEATHGTAEFYEMRARITKELIQKKGFNFMAVEADWPDAAQIDHFIRGTRQEPTDETTFNRFPTWMWANRQVLELVKWLRNYNRSLPAQEQGFGFFGLDLYSLYSSINRVIRYLEDVDKDTAKLARWRYGCLTPWQSEPTAYGISGLTGKDRDCEREVVEMLHTLMKKRLDYAARDGRRFLDAVSNARLVKNAEEYYRLMYLSSVKSWNLRDQHMFETLRHLLEFHGDDSKAIIWAHNSHVGNAQATEMGSRGEINIGSQCREHFSEQAYIIGFGTHEGTVAAASDWGKPMEIKSILPSHPDSYERLCHDAGLNAFLLPLRHGNRKLVQELKKPRLQRAIGVIYRPETELVSHYYDACLPNQFDEYIWFDKTRAVDALGPESGIGNPETFPFGL